PFWGSRIVRDIPLTDVFEFLNVRTLFSTQWQFVRGGYDPKEYERVIRTVAEPALARLQRQCIDEKILQPQVAYGYFPCVSAGDDLVILNDDRRGERTRFTFPRQDGAEGLCLSDYYFPQDSGRIDVVALMAVTVGPEVSRRTRELFERNQYQDYLFLHGL